MSFVPQLHQELSLQPLVSRLHRSLAHAQAHTEGLTQCLRLSERARDALSQDVLTKAIDSGFGQGQPPATLAAAPRLGGMDRPHPFLSARLNTQEVFKRVVAGAATAGAVLGLALAPSLGLVGGLHSGFMLALLGQLAAGVAWLGKVNDMPGVEAVGNQVAGFTGAMAKWPITLSVLLYQAVVQATGASATQQPR